MREQTSASRFVGCVLLLKVACCCGFWVSPSAVGLAEASCNVQPDAGCGVYPGTSTYKVKCMYTEFSFGTTEHAQTMPQIRQLYQSGACKNQCELCLPSDYQVYLYQRLEAECVPGCQQTCCRCLHCHLTTSLPGWLLAGCVAGAFVPSAPPSLFRHFDGPWRSDTRISYYANRTWDSENAMLTELARCVLTHDAEPWRVDAWLAASMALQVLPAVALGAWLLLSLLLPVLLLGWRLI